MRIPEFENDNPFIDWIKSVNDEITLNGSVNVDISCVDGEWIPTYRFPNGREDSLIEAHYDSLEDAVFITASAHVAGAKTNRTIQLIGGVDMRNITEKTKVTLTIQEEQH
tara:strand:+ start:281 stop:610 length:330 start_codon:yes stop_codon:yes gene_type:complete